MSDPEWTATHMLERHIAQACAEMGESRWKQLMAEWM